MKPGAKETNTEVWKMSMEAKEWTYWRVISYYSSFYQEKELAYISLRNKLQKYVVTHEIVSGVQVYHTI